MDIRKKSFTVIVVRHWNKLCREAVGCFTAVSAKLDGGLRNQI